jgi:hypothetical protein
VATEVRPATAVKLAVVGYLMGVTLAHLVPLAAVVVLQVLGTTALPQELLVQRVALALALLGALVG